MLRTVAGAVIRDFPPYAFRMGRSLLGSRAWVGIRNRNERIEWSPVQPQSARCTWIWTSELHLSRVFPATGRWLMHRALTDWPFVLAERPAGTAGTPAVSFVLGHRGIERLPLLLQTLRSIAGQRTIPCECIVIEQSVSPEITDALPSWVRYIHTPTSDPAMPYSRSWSLNVGAREARGSIVVLHDNDILVPADYAAAMVSLVERGEEILDIKRFIFYFGNEETARFCADGSLRSDFTPERVVQNARGGSIAAQRSAFLELGGFDETFVGWGGEDNEFWDRARTRRVWEYGFVPLIHLWHPPQPEKLLGAANQAQELLRSRLEIPPALRVEQLRSRNWGNPAGLSG